MIPECIYQETNSQVIVCYPENQREHIELHEFEWLKDMGYIQFECYASDDPVLKLYSLTERGEKHFENLKQQI
jgi:hypothetical protein